MSVLSKAEILKLFDMLNWELGEQHTNGELYLVGGAVMCLAFNARPATRDIDAVFAPTKIIRQAVKKIAKEKDLAENWINDAVKGFLSEKGDFISYLDLSNLKIYIPTTEYLFSMKALAMRLGAEFHDESDLRYLIRSLNIESYEEAIKIINRYYATKLVPQKTFYALEEILSK